MAKRQHPSAISGDDKDDLMALIREHEGDVVTKSAVSRRSPLTRRELEVIRLVARGRNNYEIANKRLRRMPGVDETNASGALPS